MVQVRRRDAAHPVCDIAGFHERAETNSSHMWAQKPHWRYGKHCLAISIPAHQYESRAIYHAVIHRTPVAARE